MLRRAALRFWLSRLHDLHFPRPGASIQVKPPDYFERVLVLHRDTPEASGATLFAP